jgi:hypothetical protein
LRGDRIGSIYFIECEGQHALKVGFAIDPRSRLFILQTGNPMPLFQIGEVPAAMSAEQELHRMLRPLAIAREWYPRTHLFEMLHEDLMDELEDSGAAFLTPAAVRRAARATITEFCEQGEEDEPGYPAEQYARDLAARAALRVAA